MDPNFPHTYLDIGRRFSEKYASNIDLMLWGKLNLVLVAIAAI